MGDYLKQRYEERDIAKALARLHGLIDDDTQKLYDKLHDLKLSHNRKVKLLKDFHLYLKSSFEDGRFDILVGIDLLRRIKNELENPLNTRWYNRPVDHFEQKGVKNG